MSMETKYKVILALILSIASFGFGRYSVNSVNSVKKETQVINENDKKDENTHTVTKTVTIKQPDGATETTVTQDTSTNDDTQDITSTETQVSKTSETNNKTSQLNISALAAVKGNNLIAAPIYGASLSKQLLGPVTIGVFGLTDSTIGVSLGINF